MSPAMRPDPLGTCPVCDNPDCGWYSAWGVPPPRHIGGAYGIPVPPMPTPVAEPTPRAPDSTRYLVGYRSWAVQQDVRPPVLASPLYRTPWPRRGRHEARCERHRYEPLSATPRLRHPAPEKTCQCGIYGASDLTPTPAKGYDRYAVGIIQAWGVAIPTQSGFRAQYAQPVALLHAPWRLPGTSWATIDAAAAAYNVPVLDLPLLPPERQQLLLDVIGEIVNATDDGRLDVEQLAGRMLRGDG